MSSVAKSVDKQKNVVMIITIIVLFGSLIWFGGTQALLFPKANPTRMQVEPDEILILTFAFIAFRLNQIIAGFGLPVDLDVESVTIGYVFKSQYILPYNKSQLYQSEFYENSVRRKRYSQGGDEIEVQKAIEVNSMFDDDEVMEENYTQPARQNDDATYNLANSRWIVYQALEASLDRYLIKVMLLVIEKI